MASRKLLQSLTGPHSHSIVPARWESWWITPSTNLPRFELLHDRETIDDIPGFNDQPIVIEAMQVPECRLDAAVGRRHAHNRGRMDRARRAPSHHPLSLGYDMFSDDLQVTPRLMHRCKKCPDMFATRANLPRSHLMVG